MLELTFESERHVSSCVRLRPQQNLEMKNAENTGMQYF